MKVVTGLQLRAHALARREIWRAVDDFGTVPEQSVTIMQRASKVLQNAEGEQIVTIIQWGNNALGENSVAAHSRAASALTAGEPSGTTTTHLTLLAAAAAASAWPWLPLL